ncbi:MAG: PorV/PorQ family protein [Candidatus Eisenbacteria bacterium]|uniref:PorV/PorQ family protein n=1 Tax=Eiseniibacteriota bacterium TaxID=2212470 RepID=A0A849SLT9_UNCEI|nr:PorV/PorQ family protein [Candidatus Eisenbacteria bacterium]
MTSSLRRAAISIALLLAVSVLAPEARAQFTFGDQRVGTSSGTFLRIGVGARAVGLGESFVAVANDPTAIYWNPAGIASMQRTEFAISHASWPADIQYEHAVLVMPVARLGGSIGLQFGALSTEIDETTELRPFGTGRTYFFSDMVVGAVFARRWTDKLLVGAGLKYVREDLGADVGGPVTSAVLVDIGSIYYLGYGSVRIATALSNFGSELRPRGDGDGGSFVSPVTGEVRRYDGFDPPLMFRYGVAFEPIENSQQRLTTALEVNQPADDAQIVKAGLEWVWMRRMSLRTGYNFNADELKFSAGAGVVAEIGAAKANVDYAFTEGGALGSIHRVSLGWRF